MHVFWIFLEFRPLLVLDYACLPLCIGLPFCFDYALDYVWITKATETTAMDLDSRHNCSTCKTRMSSLLYDSHLICVACRGRDCNRDNRCVECEGWSEEVMIKYVRYRKSLDSKSKASYNELQ